MSFVEVEKNFVNRKEDIKSLGKDVLQANTNTACIIHAPKGFGKTELVNKVAALYSQKHQHVQVKPEISSENVQGGYIGSVFSALLQNNHGINIRDFLKRTDNETKKIYRGFSFDQDKSQSLFTLFQKGLAWLVPVWISLLAIGTVFDRNFILCYGLPIFTVFMGLLLIDVFLASTFRSTAFCIFFTSKKTQKKIMNKIANTVSDSAFLIQFAYIKYCLQQGGYLLHLQDLQKIDSLSQKALLQCLHIGCHSNTPNYFFLEYQSGPNSQIESFIEYIKQPVAIPDQAAVNIEEFCVSALSEEHIRELAGKILVLNEQNDEDICMYWKEQAAGNLFDFIRFVSNYAPHKTALSIFERFSSLSSNQTFILLITIFSLPGTSQNDIKEICKKVSLNFDADIEVLKLNDFLVIDDSNACHCSKELLENWEVLYPKRNSLFQSAQSCFERFWWNRLKKPSPNNSIQHYQSIKELLHYYTTFSSLGLESLLNYTVDNVAIYFDRNNIKNNFSELLSKYTLEGPPLDEVLFSLVACCYNLEFYKLALDFLAMIKTDSHKKTAYIALLLYCSNEYRAAINLCQEHYSQNIPIRLKLILKETELISWRMLYNPQQCLRLFEEIKNNPVYHQFPEYGYYLRNAEIIVPVKESIKFLYKSIFSFLRFRDIRNVGITLLSLGMQYARLGQHTQAVMAFTLAEKTLNHNNVFAKHYCCVDMAAAYLLKGTKAKYVIQLLDQADSIAQTAFDQLVILTDKIAYCILSCDRERFEALVMLIESNPIPNIVQVRRSLYFNISVMYQKIGQREKADSYLARSIACHQKVTSTDPRLPLNALWQARYDQSDANLPASLRPFYRCPYHVSFISFWRFDVPDL